MIEKWRAFVNAMNDKGIPIPLIRDKGVGSVSLTLVVISSLIVIASLLGVVTKLLKGVDVSNALYWNGMCLALYYGRKINKDGNKVDISDNAK